MCGLLRVTYLAVFFILGAFSVKADPITFTFEGPEFTPGQIVPLLNRAPNSGLESFLASFSSSHATFRIGSVEPNILFSGQSLVNPGTPSVLTISFNIPVTRVEFVFGVQVSGLITLTSDVGTLSQQSAAVGGAFEGGIFVFTSAIPFTSFQLASFDLLGAPTRFAIDNLIAEPVPEPVSVVLLGTGLAALTASLHRRRKRMPQSQIESDAANDK